MQDIKTEQKNSQTSPIHASSSRKTLVVASILLGIVCIAGYAIFSMGWRGNDTFSPDAFYAAFLTNGQVYFGKIEKKTKAEFILNTVYYLQTATATEDEPQFNLVKLGQELHGPTDRLVINMDHLMFYEELKEDGAVVQSIKGTGGLQN